MTKDTATKACKQAQEGYTFSPMFGNDHIKSKRCLVCKGKHMPEELEIVTLEELKNGNSK